MISPVLKDIQIRKLAVPGRLYRDIDGTLYVGEQDGSLKLSSDKETFSKSETSNLIDSRITAIPPAAETDPVWTADKPDYATKIFSIVMSIALG